MFESDNQDIITNQTKKPIIKHTHMIPKILNIFTQGNIALIRKSISCMLPQIKCDFSLIIHEEYENDPFVLKHCWFVMLRLHYRFPPSLDSKQLVKTNFQPILSILYQTDSH